MEDGLVEVGWDGDIESDLEEAESEPARAALAAADRPSLEEEPVEDEYAALEAWPDWTGSQTRAPAADAQSGRDAPVESTAEVQSSDETSELGDEDRVEIDAAAGLSTSGLRAEPQHEYAPYSQLFTRIRQSKQPEG